MNVYVEYAVADNFVMDYLLLKLTVLGGGVKSSVKKRVLGALAGTVVAVYTPLLRVNDVVSFAIKFFTAALMVLLACECGSFAAYLKRLAYLSCFTVLFGGILLAASSAIGLSYDFFTNTVKGDFSIAPVLLSGVAVYFVCYGFVCLFLKRRAVEPFLRKCVIKIGGQIVVTTGFIDTGNSIRTRGLCEVCVADKKLAEELFKSGTLNVRSEIVYYGTASGAGTMRVYTVDELTVINGNMRNIIYKAKIGIPEVSLMFEGDYSLLLPAGYAFAGRETCYKSGR